MVKQIERTAYHEAGHAAASIILHTPFYFVTIIPEPENGNLGYVKLKYPEAFNLENTDKRTIKRIENDIIIDYCGDISVKRFVNKPLRGCFYKGSRGDIHDVVNMVSNLPITDNKTKDKQFKKLIQKAFFENDGESKKILDDYYSTLNHTNRIKEEEKILKKLYEEAIALIDNNWFAIERLAKQLLIDKKISYRKARRIVKQAFEDYDHD